jgi:rhamnose utilization protein RhaD (predicted bifunctional aldolase and dehydrogenase)
MANRFFVLRQLTEMSHTLGDPAWDCTILGEGNTSAKVDDDTFYVKASGTQLGTMKPSDFVEVQAKVALTLLERETATDAEIKDVLQSAVVGDTQMRPSVETVMHALLLGLQGVNFIAHTHPTAVNAIMCSTKAEEAVSGRLFPDEIVCCGPAPVYVPWTEPGPPLARKIRDLINAYVDERGYRPKTMLMQNHGLVALGATVDEILSITSMAVKTFKILLGAYAMGGPAFMAPDMVDRLWNRPDEVYRHKLLTGREL